MYYVKPIIINDYLLLITYYLLLVVIDYRHTRRISLNFRDESFEQQYRRQSSTACGYNPTSGSAGVGGATVTGGSTAGVAGGGGGGNEKPTLAMPRYSAFTDLAIAFAFLVVFTITCTLTFGAHVVWIVIASR